ncbi:MAG: DUF4159 domain-containing protein [Terrimicrobiaceae bacterium]|nr:DUF4159 domain-containing protein [Terrimicrobiaceae bacterium]
MSPRHTPPQAPRTWLSKLAASRDFTLSLLLHIIIVSAFGTMVLYRVVEAPPEITTGGDRFVEPISAIPAPPDPKPAFPPLIPNIPPTSPAVAPRDILQVPRVDPEWSVPTISPPTAPRVTDSNPIQPPTTKPGQLTQRQAAEIGDFVKDWVRSPRNNGGSREAEYQFTAFLGIYGGGNWASTHEVGNGNVLRGSLPNLLYYMSFASRDKIRTDYRNVRAIRLDSDELFSARPPFVFLTGARDFRLTDREVENLRRYISLGGAIWGDSSAPGRNSRFDIAFRREMKRVLPDIDKSWEPLPDDHPIFARGYFKEVRHVPGGLNHYREPVEVLRAHGQIAVLYTANDYGNMWQVGLDSDRRPDLRRNEHGQPVATSEMVWTHRDSYLRNIDPESLDRTYRFGTNVVIHLLTRWQGLQSGRAEL